MTFHTESVMQESPISMFGLLDLKAIGHLLVEIFYFQLSITLRPKTCCWFALQ